MKIDKPDRTALKSYFVKNAIPTEGNFADLIDGMINQKDDGIVKLAGEPLSVQADGNDTSLKKAINFYKNFDDPRPAWTLTLNPRGNLNDPRTAKPGWSIGDAEGNSKLFIDQTTGNIAVGTTAPAEKLDVAGNIKFNNVLSTPERMHITGGELLYLLHKQGVIIGKEWGGTGDLTVQGAIRAGNSDIYFTDINHNHTGIGNNTGYAAIENATDHGALMILGRNIATPPGRVVKLWDYLQVNGRLDVTGNLGIGTAAPTHRLHVVANDAVGLFESSGTQAYLRLSTKEGLDNRVEIANRPGGRLSLWTAGAGDAFNIVSGGNVGIGTTGPAEKLDVAGNIKFNNTLSTPGRMHITGGELLYLLHKQGVIIGKEWGGSGDLTVQGDITLSGRIGILGESPVPRTPGWGGGIHTWDIEAEGTVWSRGGYQSGARDLAENYLSDMDLEPGEVVSLDTKKHRIVRSEKPNDTLLLGVVSSKPGFLLNVDHEIEKGGLFPVALCGSVPCKVVNENGPIKRGDLLASSSTPGHAMRAKPIEIGGENFYRPGTIIGKALDPLNSSKGVIDVFVFSS